MNIFLIITFLLSETDPAALDDIESGTPPSTNSFAILQHGVSNNLNFIFLININLIVLLEKILFDVRLGKTIFSYRA